MKTDISLWAFGACLLLVGCAQPETEVLPPFELADGRTYQSVVTIGANGNGTSPTITKVDTFALLDGAKGAGPDCGCLDKPVSTASGAAPGIWTTLMGGVVPLATGVILADALDDETADADGSSAGGGAAYSDMRLKTDVRRLGASPSGLGIYAFRYRDGTGLPLDTATTFVGVMAQELQKVAPGALITTESGYFAVDYSQLDVPFTTLDAWEAAKMH